ncbi:hypothetical protein SAMN05216350_10648 [Polaromonas sp. YR568]|uniref:hypothetical protein n=1 Tax=Polaromonas sp. YR568 TaxID=1855301 RepID=UPI0008E716E0|nr:hypothetical protein [Polaromonas sp. YR568]SFU83556.1 hypothetical protein SAMN05216350_10648 [Polaromonas sp. YR568]
MKMPSHPSRGALAAMAAALLCLLAWPGVRHGLEASMTRHMLLQYPLLMLAGYLLATALPGRWLARLNPWNAHGISGLFATAVMLAILMIPRVLDLALVDWRIEILKCLALLACGAAIRLSWQAAGLLVQGFFLGNVLPMMVVAGNLYETSPVRVCNAYLLDDQARLGQMLVWIAAAIAAAWFAWLVRALMRRDAAMLPGDMAGKPGLR